MANRKNRQDNIKAMDKTNRIRRQADEGYEKYDYDDDDYYDDDLASKRAGMGCLIAFLVFVLIIGGILLYFWMGIKSEIDGKKATASETVAVDIGAGYGGRTIGKILEENGLISNADIFRFYVRFKGDAKFQAGHFYLEPGMSYDEMIEIMSQPPPARDSVRVTFPEGSTVYQFGRVLEDAGLCTVDEFVEEANNGDFSDIPFFQYVDITEDTYMRAEGYLAPDTYDFFADESVHNIVRKLYEQFDSLITSEMYERMEEQGLSLTQTITLASLVEEEAGLPEHQPEVAGVFWNRLTGDLAGTDLNRRTMGSDVCYYYIRDWVSRSYNDDMDQIPDNIFYGYYSADNDPQVRDGLPVGPISSPSKTAIEAALWPEEHNYYYFLTDFYGNYYYATNFYEHSINVDTMKRMNAQYEAEQGAEEAAEGEEVMG